MALLSCCFAAAGCSLFSGRVNPAEVGPVPPPVSPTSQREIKDAIDRGVAFLVQNQNSNGSWGSSSGQDYMVICPVPGGHIAFRTATTALCVLALIEAKSDIPGADEALERGEEWLLDNLPKVRLSSERIMYNNWAHGFGTQTLARMLRERPLSDERRRRIVAEIEGQFQRLKRYQHLDGGWGYYSWGYIAGRTPAAATSFTTAVILVAMHEALEAGVPPPKGLAETAVRELKRQRKPDFSYSYYFGSAQRSPMYEMNLAPASLGRTQTCNLAMRRWGDKATTDAVIKAWLNRLFARDGWLSMARKQQFPHEGYFRIAAYFFYQGHYYAAHCIHLLPPEERPFFQNQLAHVLLPLQEKDGSWWDFPLYDYHQQYGTAYAIMALRRCLRSDDTANDD